MTKILKNKQNKEDILTQSFNGYLDVHYIMDKYIVSLKTAQRTLKLLNLKHIDRNTLAIIKDCNEGLELKLLAKKYNCSIANIYSILNRWQSRGLVTFRQNYDLTTNTPKLNRLNIQEDYFNKIDSPNKAYLLGFIFADGAIEKKKNSVIIPTCDYEIIDLFNKETLSEYKVQKVTRKEEWRPLYIINVSNKVFVNNLIKYGFDIKSNRVIKKELIPHIFWRDFIRGYFDGDGNYSIYKNNSSTRNSHIKHSFTITSPYKLLTYIKEIIIEGSNLSTKMHLRHLLGKNSAVLSQSGGKSCSQIINWLYYPNCFCLKRKRTTMKHYEK